MSGELVTGGGKSVRGEEGSFAGSPRWAMLPDVRLARTRRAWLGAGERERSVVGGFEDLEVREPVGEAHDRLAGGTDDPGGHAEQQVA